MQPLMQPRQRKARIAVDGGKRNAKQLSRLFHCASQKVFQLHRLSLCWAQLLKLIERAGEVDGPFFERLDPCEFRLERSRVSVLPRLAARNWRA